MRRARDSSVSPPSLTHVTPNSDPAAVSQFHVLVVPAVDLRGGKRRKLELDGRFVCGSWGPSEVTHWFWSNLSEICSVSKCEVSVRARKCFYGAWDRRGEWQYSVRRPRRRSELQLCPKPVS